MPRAKPADRRRKLEEQCARINAEIQRVRSWESQEERKRETRRKIPAGAIVLLGLAFGLLSGSAWAEQTERQAIDRALQQLAQGQQFVQAAQIDFQEALKDFAVVARYLAITTNTDGQEAAKEAFIGAFEHIHHSQTNNAAALDSLRSALGVFRQVVNSRLEACQSQP